MLPPHYLFFEAQRSWIEAHPVTYLATTGAYYFLSLKLLNVRCQKIINVSFACYVALQFLSLIFMFLALFWDSIHGMFD